MDEIKFELSGFFSPLIYIWRAIYNDKSELIQFDSSGKEHLFSDIDQQNLLEFSWIPTVEGLKSYSIKIKPDQRLIAFRRNRISAITGQITTIYALGWQSTINGNNIKSILWIGEDVSVITDDI